RPDHRRSLAFRGRRNGRPARRPGADRASDGERPAGLRVAGGRARTQARRAPRIEEGRTVKLAIWSTTTPRENSTYVELFERQLQEAVLAERIGIDQMRFLEHHLQPAATPSPNLMIAASAQRTTRLRFANMVNIL